MLTQIIGNEKENVWEIAFAKGAPLPAAAYTGIVVSGDKINGEYGQTPVTINFSIGNGELGGIYASDLHLYKIATYSETQKKYQYTNQFARNGKPIISDNFII